MKAIHGPKINLSEKKLLSQQMPLTENLENLQLPVIDKRTWSN